MIKSIAEEEILWHKEKQKAKKRSKAKKKVKLKKSLTKVVLQPRTSAKAGKEKSLLLLILIKKDILEEKTREKYRSGAELERKTIR